MSLKCSYINGTTVISSDTPITAMVIGNSSMMPWIKPGRRGAGAAVADISCVPCSGAFAAEYQREQEQRGAKVEQPECGACVLRTQFRSQRHRAEQFTPDHQVAAVALERGDVHHLSIVGAVDFHE